MQPGPGRDLGLKQIGVQFCVYWVQSRAVDTLDAEHPLPCHVVRTGLRQAWWEVAGTGGRA